MWSLVRPYGLIGFCGHRTAEGASDEQIELLYGIHPDHWGEGLVAEAARAVLRYGFETCQMGRVVAATDTPNQQAVRVLQKLGMVFEARRQFHGLDLHNEIVGQIDLYTITEACSVNLSDRIQRYRFLMDQEGNRLIVTQTVYRKIEPEESKDGAAHVLAADPQDGHGPRQIHDADGLDRDVNRQILQYWNVLGADHLAKGYSLHAYHLAVKTLELRRRKCPAPGP